MRDLLYSIFLIRYGITYIDCFKSADNGRVVYGYSKKSRAYSFWKVHGFFDLDLIEVANSKEKAYFSYTILHRGC